MPTDHPIEPEGAVNDLAEALAAAGITLPSLRLDLPPEWIVVAGSPLVELGRCNLATAHKLAAVLRAGAGR